MGKKNNKKNNKKIKLLEVFIKSIYKENRQ
jgi:hypothetical protein